MTNKETMELIESLLTNKEIRFDWFMHILDEEKRKKIQELVQESKVVVIPFALIIGVLDEGKLTTEGCFTVRFDGTDTMKIIAPYRIGDGTYNEEARKEGTIYPNGAPESYQEVKERLANENSEHGETFGTTYGVPPVPSSADNPEWEGKE